MQTISSILKKSISYMFWGSIIVAVGAMFPPKIEQWHGMQKRRDHLHSEIKQIKSDIFKMQENQQRLKTDRDFVERVARENRRVQPGELVFIFDDHVQ